MSADYWQFQEQCEREEYEAWLDTLDMPAVWRTKRIRKVAVRLICDNGPGFAPISKPHLTGNYHA